MTKRELKNKAIELRSMGKTLREIKNELNVSKASVSYWVREVRLSESQIAAIRDRVNAPDGAVCKSNKRNTSASKERWAAINLGRRSEGLELARSSERFRLLCSLYWAEGAKSSFCFVNSDVGMVRLFCRLLSSHYDAPTLKLTIRIYDGKSNASVESAVSTWREATGISNIKIILLHSDSDYSGKFLEFGTAALTGVKDGWFMRIQGGIDYLRTIA